MAQTDLRAALNLRVLRPAWRARLQRHLVSRLLIGHEWSLVLGEEDRLVRDEVSILARSLPEVAMREVSVIERRRVMMLMSDLARPVALDLLYDLVPSHLQVVTG